MKCSKGKPNRIENSPDEGNSRKSNEMNRIPNMTLNSKVDNTDISDQPINQNTRQNAVKYMSKDRNLTQIKFDRKYIKN